MEVEIKKLGIPDHNGNIYTVDSFKDIENWKNIPVLLREVGENVNSTIDEASIADMIGDAGTFSIHDNILYADINFTNKNFVELNYGMGGVGKLVGFKNDKVEDFEIKYIVPATSKK